MLLCLEIVCIHVCVGVSTSAESAVFTAVYGGPRNVVTDTDVVVAIRVTVTVQVLTRLRGDRC